jgi:carbon-monoxide dehydrogenase medium subunit
MTPFELVEPRSLEEAIGLLDPEDPSIRPIAGGTGLMLMMKAGVFRPTRLVSLHAIEPRYREITATSEGLRIGAMTPLRAVERSPAVAETAPVVVRTMRTLSNVRVRNVATVGGSLAHADPHMDLPPVLIALGAAVIITGPAGERTLPVEELYSGYYETVLARNELIGALILPRQGSRRAVYLKVTTRTAHDWPALGVAVSVETAGGIIRNPRVVVSAATEKAVRLTVAESALDGHTGDEATVKRAAEAAAEEAVVVADVRGSAAYKRELVRIYVGRALRAALANTNETRH